MQARGIGQRDRMRFLLRRPEFSFMRSRKHALARLRATVMRAIVIEERFCARMFSFVLFACERAFLDVRKVSSETLFKLFLFMRETRDYRETFRGGYCIEYASRNHVLSSKRCARSRSRFLSRTVLRSSAMNEVVTTSLVIPFHERNFLLLFSLFLRVSIFRGN